MRQGSDGPAGQDAAPLGVDVDVPHSARIYDYWLGGKDNFAVDRAVAEAMAEAVPGLPHMARENRRFVHRVIRDLVVREGIRHFIDVGTGIPTRPNLHEIAQGIEPRSRVVYVDNDPTVLVHARALMVSKPEGRSEYVSADLRDPKSILEDATLRQTFDLDEPVGLTLIAILMLIADAEDPWARVAELRDALPSGSCLAVTHPTADFAPEQVEQAVSAATGAGLTLVVRSREAVRRFFGDWEILSPGVVPVSHWRPEETVTDAKAAYYWSGVARKP